MVPLQWYLMLSAAVFVIGMFGFLTRKNIIIMFMSVELMLNAVNISLISFSHYLQDMRGHILVFFVVTVAACRGSHRSCDNHSALQEQADSACK